MRSSNVSTIADSLNRSLLAVRKIPAQLLAVTGVLLTGALVLLWKDPHVPGELPTCPTYALTGLYCPGCGSLRACRDVLEGRWGEAFGHNVLLLPALAWIGWWAVAKAGEAKGRGWRQPPRGVWFSVGLLVVVVVFTVVRNLPFASFLAP